MWPEGRHGIDTVFVSGAVVVLVLDDESVTTPPTGYEWARLANSRGVAWVGATTVAEALARFPGWVGEATFADAVARYSAFAGMLTGTLGDGEALLVGFPKPHPLRAEGPFSVRLRAA